MSWVCVTRYHWERVASVFYFLILYHLVDHRRPFFFEKNSPKASAAFSGFRQKYLFVLGRPYLPFLLSPIFLLYTS